MRLEPNITNGALAASNELDVISTVRSSGFNLLVAIGKLDTMGVVFQSPATVFCSGCLLAILSFSRGATAQSVPPNPQKPCTAPCPTPPPDNPGSSPTQQFPYPGETKKPAPQTTDPDAPSSAAPDGPAPTAPGNAPAKQFPYPGESKPPDSDGSSSSSSSSSDPSAPSANPDNPSDSPDDTKTDNFPRRRLPKVRNLQSDEDRETEDLTVARFYIDKGNWNAAYLRSKDAVKHGPDDPDAHMLLAETALKLNKKDEAVTEYNAIFKLDSSERQIKAARKALASLK
jgi:Tetratricopeptide repeat